MKALLIGINQYKTLKSLNGCIKDVETVRDALVSNAGLKVSDIQILQDADATTANIRKGLGDLAAVAVQGQRLWIHFSGHGSQLLTTDPNEPDGLDEVLCPYDYDGQPNNAIRDDDLIQCLNAIPATSELIVTLDCCHSGDYSRGGPTVRTPHNVSMAVANAKRTGVSRYNSIRTVGLSPNCLVISACQPSQLAYETNSPKGLAGAFTNAFFAQVNASPHESVRTAVEVAAIALSSYPQTPVMEGSDRLRDDSFVIASRGLGRNVLRPRGTLIIWSQEWGFNAAGSGGTVSVRASLIDGNFWLECFVNMFGIRPAIIVPLGEDVNESFAIAFGFSLTLGVSNFSLGHGQLSFRLKIGVKTSIPFIPPVTVVDSPISIPLSGLTRSAASIESLADLVAFQALQPKPPVAGASRPGRTRNGGSRFIEFRHFRCITAEALFGDTIDIFFEEYSVVQGLVANTGQPAIALQAGRRAIPEGGGFIHVWQYYAGQPAEPIKNVLITPDMPPGPLQIEMLEKEDGDPGGRYFLGVQII